MFAPDDLSLWDCASSDETAVAKPIALEHAVQPPSRRGIAIAGLVSVVAVVVGTIAFSSESKSDTAATTTLPATTSTLRALLEPTIDEASADHYLVDDPALRPYSADIVTPAAEGELFIAWGGQAPTDPFVTVQVHDTMYEPYGILGATRRLVDGVELISPIGQDATVIVEFAIDDARSATLQTNGVTDADILQILSTLAVLTYGDGGIGFDSGLMTRLGLSMVFKGRSIEEWLFGTVESSVLYFLPDGTGVTLRSAPDAGGPDGLILSLANNVNSPYRNRVAGAVNLGGESIVVWRTGGRRLSLVAAIDQTALVELSEKVRPATDMEWRGMVYGLRPDFRLGDFKTIGTGITADGEAWRAGPQITERRGRTEFLWWWTVPGRVDVTASAQASAVVPAQPNVDTLVVPGATFVFVSHPTAGGMVTVLTADGTGYRTGLEKPFEQSSVYIAVIRIEEPGPVTVAIDGVTVDT